MARDDRGVALAPRDVGERAQVQADWEEAFGSPPPPRLSVAFMLRAVAHARQCRAEGGISPA